MKKNNKGFTLIELLAVIVILAIVLGFTAYIAINAIKNAKENSYQVTITNIEKEASNYLLENSDKLFFLSLDDNNEDEYQCVSVQDLIDLGYLKEDVTNSKIDDDKYVKKDDYVYVERNISNKTVVKSSYALNSDDSNVCKNAANVSYDISFLVLPNDEWARERKIDINYKLKDVENSEELKKYTYKYTFDGDIKDFEDFKTAKRFTATSEGKITAIIEYNGIEFGKKDIQIKNIDRVGPTIELGSYSGGNVRNTVTIPLLVNDVGSGVDYNSFTKEDITVMIGDSKIDNYTLNHGSNENYTLTINDNTHIGKVVIKIGDSNVLDKVKNGNNEVTLNPDITFVTAYRITASANGGTIPATTGWTGSGETVTKEITYGSAYGTLPIPTRTGYNFNGWYTEINGGNKVESTSIVKNDQNIYANWTAQTVTINYNANGGTGAPSATTYTYDVSGTTNLSSTKPTRTDYNFLGWSTSSTATEATYTAGQAWNRSNLGTNNAYTLYAVWEPSTITVTINYNANGGTGAPSATTYTYATSGTTNLSSMKPTRTGYTFLGWSTSSTATEATYMAGQAWDRSNLGTDNAYTLYAVWGVSKVNIQFDMNGGSLASEHGSTYSNSGSLVTNNGSTIIQTIEYGNSLGSSGLINWDNSSYLNVVKNGYIAKDGSEWCLTMDGTGKCYSDSAVYSANDFCDASNGDCTVTLYVNWVEQPVRVYFNVNGGYIDVGQCAVGNNTAMPCQLKGQFAATCEKASCSSESDLSYAYQLYDYTKTDDLRNVSTMGITKLNYWPKNAGEWCTQSNGGGTCINQDDKVNISYSYLKGLSKAQDSTQPTNKRYYVLNLYVNWINVGGSSGGSDGGGCFLAGTKVRTIYGYKDIDKIKIGDMVLSYNEKTKMNEYKLVYNTFIHKDNKHNLYELTIDNSILKVTDVHRFYIYRNGNYKWLSAKELVVGDMVRYADGTLHKIDKISYSYQTNTVYNFSVQDNHNYYVSDKMILVHNAKTDQGCELTSSCVLP